ncbi:intraflagellar transport protein 74 homolog [Gadus chalcogrammus]|uniref:intraflagellar transport protein 74 homolog n=1 Tax=Gadus chalcogrammus TaxID=1042646 RepID=UPI0024C3A8AC|nr:intraflagellar transport protein 74 homolog [Gadus chalcogrammus]
MASHWTPSSVGRPASRGGSQISSALRPLSAIRPPPTSSRAATGMVPSTASRPGTRGSRPVAIPGVLSAHIQVTERPVTQQGLSGMTTGIKGPQRQILDKSYYLGQLRSKINELTTETSKLHKEIDNFNQENSVYLSYEKRAEGLAGEIRDLQGQLADYNMLVDKLNTNTDMEEVINDHNILKVRNDREAESMDVIFTERREREEAIGVTGEAIQKERHIANEVIKALPPAEHDKYAAMMLTNEELLQEQSVCQEELEAMLTRKVTLDAELFHSPMKQEAICIQEKLLMLEARRDSMVAENKSFDSPQEERERLFKQVKEDNQEIASMDRQLGEMSERGEQITEEISQLEHHTDEAQVECGQKYKELKKREEEIDRFLELFEETRIQETSKSTQQQSNIVILLEHSSKNLSSLHQIARVTVGQLKSMHEVLSHKEKEVVQSQTTARGLTTESHRLQQDLEKVQQLEGKITEELGTLKEKIVSMKAELVTFGDLDTLKNTAESRKKTLQDDSISMTQQRDYLRQLLQLNKNYEVLKMKLKENETNAQLANMERKLQHLEQNNFVMKDFIASKAQESNYGLVTKTVIGQLNEYNRGLTDVQQNNRS